MDTLVPLIFFLVGAILASFVGVVVARCNTGESIAWGRSRCDACGVLLGPASLVPIFSFLVSRGRAQCCGARTSVSAPLSELILGCLFAWSYAELGFSTALFFFLIALAALLALVSYDLIHQILPTSFLILFLLASAAYAISTAPSGPALGSWFIVAGAEALFLALITLVSGGRMMGLADAPLTFGLALLVGTNALSGFVFSFWIGAVIGIAILLQRPPGSRMGVEVPLAPFLAAGFLLAYFTGWNLFTLLVPFS